MLWIWFTKWKQKRGFPTEFFVSSCIRKFVYYDYYYLTHEYPSTQEIGVGRKAFGFINDE